MAVQKHYESYAAKKMSNIVFEGDRLFTSKNILYLIENYDTREIILEQAEDVLERRHQTRQDNQTATFLRSRNTKIGNILAHEPISAIAEVKTLDKIEQTQQLAEELTNWLKS